MDSEIDFSSAYAALAQTDSVAQKLADLDSTDADLDALAVLDMMNILSKMLESDLFDNVTAFGEFLDPSDASSLVAALVDDLGRSRLRDKVIDEVEDIFEAPNARIATRRVSEGTVTLETGLSSGRRRLTDSSRGKVIVPVTEDSDVILSAEIISILRDFISYCDRLCRAFSTL